MNSSNVMSQKRTKGGVLNLVTKRGLCLGSGSRITWAQVESGASVTWKYPSCELRGDNSRGEFYSVALTKGHQIADTGTKMIHIGSGTTSKIVSKSISAGYSKTTYRGLVDFRGNPEGCRSFSRCDSLLIGDKSTASTLPVLRANSDRREKLKTGALTTANSIEHEASTSRVSEEQLEFLCSRGIPEADAVSLLLGGFCDDVFAKLPVEFAAEAIEMLRTRLKGTVG